MGRISERNIAKILEEGENETVEFKTRIPPTELIERFVYAFANTKGGSIVFGYDDQKKELIGIPPGMISLLQNMVEKLKLERYCETYTVSKGETDVLVLDVKKANNPLLLNGVEYTRIEDKVFSKIREIRSSHLKNFIKEIQYKNRNPRDTKALELLNDCKTNPVRVLLAGSKLYRCRVISDMKKAENGPLFWGYGEKDSFVPPAEATRDLRANYRYIPYLYCANHPYTALVEVRPRLGANVSVATIEVKEELQLLDFTMSMIPKNMSEVKRNLFSDLSMLYSKPVASDDDILDYIPTQYIAEFAKHLGYDGIVFRSSLTPELDEYSADNYLDRYNVVVFNYQKCVPVKSNVVNVTRNHIEYQQNDGDIEKLDTE